MLFIFRFAQKHAFLWCLVNGSQYSKKTKREGVCGQARIGPPCNSQKNAWHILWQLEHNSRYMLYANFDKAYFISASFQFADDESAVQSINGIWRVREFRGGSSAKQVQVLVNSRHMDRVEIGHSSIGHHLWSFEQGIFRVTHGHTCRSYEGRYFAALDTSETCLALEQKVIHRDRCENVARKWQRLTSLTLGPGHLLCIWHNLSQTQANNFSIVRKCAAVSARCAHCHRLIAGRAFVPHQSVAQLNVIQSGALCAAREANHLTIQAQWHRRHLIFRTTKSHANFVYTTLVRVSCFINFSALHKRGSASIFMNLLCVCAHCMRIHLFSPGLSDVIQNRWNSDMCKMCFRNCCCQCARRE